MSSVKNIGVVTATRAEYGLFIPLLREIVDNKELILKLFVTGTHLSHEFGFTKKNIIEDGFEICEEIDCIIGNDTPPAVAKTSGLALIGLTEAFDRKKPDLIFLLGDRYETLCAALAASFCRIPVAHLHGGEITEGAYDEGFRHAITKLSHIHFTSSEEHRKRVIQMGESPASVFNVGAIGIDSIKSLEPISKETLESDLDIVFKDRSILVTLHPETLSPGSSTEYVKILIKALKEIEDCTILITGSNADSEGRVINSMLKEFASKQENCLFVQNLGQIRYLSVLNIVDMVVGNSSSGIIEVPVYGIPTINIGDRQKGRLHADSVVDVVWDVNKIIGCILQSFSIKGNKINNPYGDGTASKQILDIITKKINVEEILKKAFFDLK